MADLAQAVRVGEAEGFRDIMEKGILTTRSGCVKQMYSNDALQDRLARVNSSR
jgi:hypothetical protein